MCGISGFNWKNKDKIQEMVSSLSHRGPDAEGIFLDEGISLGHNRLSVIDLSEEANQPMADNSGDLIIIFNGEIYNFNDLKKELQGSYKFKTKSDTEVILAGYLKWGKNVVQKLNGMFAFAIWNKKERRLFCARDHAGMKPFYYFWDGKKFIFASEIKAILRHNIPKKLNTDALNHYLRILYVPESMTLIEHVHKLPPSHTLSLIGDRLSIEEFKEPIIKFSNLHYHEAVRKVKEVTTASVERHLISDVPIGVYLSGGIDSSVILASVSKLQSNTETFSVGFYTGTGASTEKFNADITLAERTARNFGAQFNPLYIGPSEAMEALEIVSEHNSDPISNPTSIAMFLLSQFAKQKVTVALTGNGGDEYWGGYERYRKALMAGFLYGTSDMFTRFMFQKDNVLGRFVNRNFFSNGSEIGKFYYEKYFKDNYGDAAECLMCADQKSWLPDHFFMLSDHMSMASALEERMPLLDKQMVELSRGLPRKYKVSMFRTKKILKDAFKDDLPEYLFNQPKRGWFSPAAKWLRVPEFSEYTRGVLSKEYNTETARLFNWVALQSIFERHVSGEEYNLSVVWAVLTFQIWAKKFKISLI